MNCIDAVEGTGKAVLMKFLDLSVEYRMDVSEYIRNVKAVVDAIALFVKDNPEISETPDLLREVLCDHARSQWLARLERNMVPDAEAGEAGETDEVEYQAYCYDYIFAHGNYPR